MGDHSNIIACQVKALKSSNLSLIGLNSCLNQSKMKIATILSMAFAVTFIVEQSTAKYLLVEIDGEIDDGLGSIDGIERSLMNTGVTCDCPQTPGQCKRNYRKVKYNNCNGGFKCCKVPGCLIYGSTCANIGVDYTCCSGLCLARTTGSMPAFGICY